MGNEDINRIRNLERKYSETNVAKGEILSTETRKQINRTYYKNQQQRVVDGILNEVKNRDTIKEEVHDIIDEVRIKDLCKNCKEELIISCIILYCSKARNNNFVIEKSPLWSKYEITWRKYSLIVSRLLDMTRQGTRIKCKRKVDNEDFIRW